MPCSSLITSQNLQRAGRRTDGQPGALAPAAPLGPANPSGRGAAAQFQARLSCQRALGSRGDVPLGRTGPPALPRPEGLGRGGPPTRREPGPARAHLGADLVPALARLDVHDLPHGASSALAARTARRLRAPPLGALDSAPAAPPRPSPSRPGQWPGPPPPGRAPSTPATRAPSPISLSQAGSSQLPPHTRSPPRPRGPCAFPLPPPRAPSGRCASLRSSPRPARPGLPTQGPFFPGCLDPARSQKGEQTRDSGGTPAGGPGRERAGPWGAHPSGSGRRRSGRWVDGKDKLDPHPFAVPRGGKPETPRGFPDRGPRGAHGPRPPRVQTQRVEGCGTREWSFSGRL